MGGKTVISIETITDMKQKYVSVGTAMDHVHKTRWLNEVFNIFYLMCDYCCTCAWYLFVLLLFMLIFFDSLHCDIVQRHELLILPRAIAL